MDEEFYNDEDYFNDKNSTDEEDNDLTSNENNDKANTVGDQYKEHENSASFLNPMSIKERIDETLELLNSLKTRNTGSLSRTELLMTLSKDVSEYYGYLPELADYLLTLFSPSECVEYMDSSDRPRPLVIRTNTLKITRKDLMDALTKRGAAVEGIDWSKVAIKVTESTIPIGATPEYLAGYYMLQSAASMNPVLALSPMPNERVLDMSAAPGGKTSYIAQLMKNTGIIIANDLKPQRQKATIANLHRMGIKNSIVTSYDGRKLSKVMKGFDRVLLDAPCSGLGVISRDQSVKIQRTIKDIQRIAHLQKELLCSAIDCASLPVNGQGGVIVYSTCSISIEENEQVIEYILNKRFVKLIDTGLTVGKPGYTRFQDKRFHSSMNLTKRFYPHVHNMDGFFVAKLLKLNHGVKTSNYNDDEDNNYNNSDDINIPDIDIDIQQSNNDKKIIKGKKNSSKIQVDDSDNSNGIELTKDSDHLKSVELTNESNQEIVTDKNTKVIIKNKKNKRINNLNMKSEVIVEDDDNVVPELVPVPHDYEPTIKRQKSNKNIKTDSVLMGEASNKIVIIDEDVTKTNNLKKPKRLSIKELRMKNNR